MQRRIAALEKTFMPCPWNCKDPVAGDHALARQRVVEVLIFPCLFQEREDIEGALAENLFAADTRKLLHRRVPERIAALMVESDNAVNATVDQHLDEVLIHPSFLLKACDGSSTSWRHQYTKTAGPAHAQPIWKEAPKERAEYSSRRKPWVIRSQTYSSPGGAKDSRLGFLTPLRGSLYRLRYTHDLRHGLHSVAPFRGLVHPLCVCLKIIVAIRYSGGNLKKGMREILFCQVS